MLGHPRMPTSTHRFLAGLAIAALTGCSEEGAAAPGEAGRQCAAANEHLAACLDEPVQLGDDCDVDAASMLLAQDCAALSDPGKADFFAGVLCSAGILRHCPAPSCTPDDETLAELESVEACADLIDLPGCASCDYYLCRDDARTESCGAAGYYAGFGHAYCDRFTQDAQPMMSEVGQRWLDDVRTCLQLALEDIDDEAISCEALQTLAYATHPQCYVEAGFCELPRSDAWTVVNTVDFRDLGIRQALETGVSCFSDFLDE